MIDEEMIEEVPRCSIIDFTFCWFMVYVSLFYEEVPIKIMER